jgi:predicted MFS family arabinose efflux permease
MSIRTSPVLAPQHRAALRAVRLIFALTGLLFATWAARIPTVKADLGLTAGELAITLAGLNLGAVFGLRLGGVVAPRFGSRGILRVAMPLFACSLSGLLLAGGLVGLTAAVFVFAVANSVVDVAMNAHGVSLERVTGRAMLSGMHAYHSLGAITGALLGALAELVRLPVPAHFAMVSVLVAAVSVAGSRSLLSARTDAVPSAPPALPGAKPGRRAARWPLPVKLLGLLAFCMALAEGAANDWATVYLHEEVGASTSVAALGFGLFATAMFGGRLLGDRLVGRFGPMQPFLVGTLIAGSGFGVALLIGSTTAGLVGLALFGFGLSYTLPITFAAGGAVPGLHPSYAIANISTLGYLGFFSGPAIIGLVAENFGLTVGMAVPVVVVLLAACGAPILHPARMATQR